MLFLIPVAVFALVALVVVFGGPLGSRLMRLAKWLKSLRKGD